MSRTSTGPREVVVERVPGQRWVVYPGWVLDLVTPAATRADALAHARAEGVT